MNTNTKIYLTAGIVTVIIIGVLAYNWKKSNLLTTEEPSQTSMPETQNQTQNCDAAVCHFADAAKTIKFDYSSIFQFTEGSAISGASWRQNAKQPGNSIATLSLPQSFMPNTNFADATLTIGSSTDKTALSACGTVDKEIGQSAPTETRVGLVPFLKFNSTEGAAGNFYETTSYRAIVNGSCYAVEYIIHSHNIGSYPPEAGIKKFDKAKVVSALEKVVQSILFLGKGK